MVYTIDITDESAIKIFQSVITQDYEMICETINSYKQRDVISDSEKEDIVSYLQTRDAMEVLIDYYFVYEQAQDIKNRYR